MRRIDKLGLKIALTEAVRRLRIFIFLRFESLRSGLPGFGVLSSGLLNSGSLNSGSLNFGSLNFGILNSGPRKILIYAGAILALILPQNILGRTDIAPDNRSEFLRGPSPASRSQPGETRRYDPIRTIQEAQRGIPMMSIGQAQGAYVSWRGCDNSIVQIRNMNHGRHGFGEPGCPGRDISKVHPNFARHLNRYLYHCVARAAQKAGLPRPAFVQISSRSTFRPNSYIGNTGRLSEHAKGRAIDIGMFQLFDAQRRPIAIPGPRPRGLHARGAILAHVEHYNKNRGVVKPFYDDFRDCWRQSLKPRCSYAGGSIGCVGSHGVTNKAHNDHIHLEFPQRCD